MNYPVLFLRKREDRRLRAGHHWVFSNEVDQQRSSLKSFVPGSLIEIRASNERSLGIGYINPHSLICARLLTQDPAVAPDRAWLVQQIERALALRSMLYERPFYRLIYGDSDGLSGLVVDRYNDVLVVQISTAGMEAMLEDVVAALDQVFQPTGILLRNDTRSRALEGLPSYVDIAMGTVPEVVTVEEENATFSIRSAEGQKTGWFFDQRDNRQRLLRYVKQRRVLDLFSYVGAWGVRAALAGASHVTCVDSSAMALIEASQNAQANGVSVDTLKADVFDALAQLKAAGETFDVVVSDPPAFIQRRKDQKEGLKAYLRLHQMCMDVLAENGILIAASCSYHLSRDELGQSLRKAAIQRQRQLQILEYGGQGPDHPIHPAIPETEYLKAFFCRVW